MDITKKTIFDYCNDEKLRKSIIGDYDKEYYNSFPTSVKMSHLREYAAQVNNVELFNEATKAMNSAEKEFETEREAAQEEGRIVDY